ncbi:MAG: 7TM-DISM domain-containing protein, partial [Bacteroidota bacterium]
MIRKCCVGFILLLAMLSFQAQSVIIDSTLYQDALNQWYDLSENVEFQIDTEGELKIFDLTQSEQSWQKLSKLTSSAWSENLWLKIPFQNELDHPIDLAFLLYSDQLTAWLLPEKSTQEPMFGGSLHKRSLWNSQQHSPVFSSPYTLQFELTANSKQTLYLHLAVNDRNLLVEPKLCKREFFLNASVKDFNRILFTQSFIQGVLWIMLLYHFAMFWM